MSADATPAAVAPATSAAAVPTGDVVPSATAPPAASGATDAKVTEAPQKIEVAESVSKHFAELERRKLAFAQEQKAHAERLKSEEADRKEFEEFRNNRGLAKKDPVKAFGMLGLTADDVAKALYEAPQAPTPIDELQTKLSALQAKIDADAAAKAAEQEAAADAENMKIVHAKIAEVVAKPDYELTRAHGQEGADLIVDVMTKYWAKFKQVLPFEQAAAHVEAKFEAIAEKALTTEKYKRKLSAKVDEPKPADVPKAADPKPKSADPKVVISNKTTADTPPSDQRPSDADKKKAAIRVLNERMAAKRAAFAKKGA